MNLTRINIVLAVLLVLTSLFAVSLKVDYSKPNIEFLPTMVHSPAYDAYAANPNFPNGRTLQAPVPGTIPRGELPLYYTASKEDAVRAGLELKNPFALDAPIEIGQEAPSAGNDTASKTATNTKKTKKLSKEELAETLKMKKLAAAQARLNASIERGAEIFNTFCITCHGPSGLGDGPVTKRGFPPPPPLPTGKSSEMKDGQLFHILTYGQGSMAPMISQLSRSQRWDAINYVRTLQKGKKPAGTVPPADGKKAVTSGTESKPAAKAETKPQSKTGTKSAPKPESKVDSKTKPKAASKTAPEKKTEKKTGAKPEQKPQVESKSASPDPKTAKPDETGKTPQAEEKKP